MLNLPTPRPRRVPLLLLPMTLALLSTFLALPVLAAQVNPGPAPAGLDVLALLKLLMTHQWLPLAILLVLWVRTLLSEKSKFPWSIPATWLPTVTAFFGAVAAVLVAVQGGASVSVAVLAALAAAAASGFFDGLLVAIFGDASKAPWWARMIVGIVDQVAGGSGSASAKKTPAAPAPSSTVAPVAKRLALACTALLCLLLVDCKSGQPQPVPPNVAPIVNGALVLTECGWTTYTTDTGKVPPDSWQQIALDLATQCGMDVADFVQAFGAKHPVTLAAQAQAPAVHAAALAAKASK